MHNSTQTQLLPPLPANVEALSLDALPLEDQPDVLASGAVPVSRTARTSDKLFSGVTFKGRSLPSGAKNKLVSNGASEITTKPTTGATVLVIYGASATKNVYKNCSNVKHVRAEWVTACWNAKTLLPVEQYIFRANEDPLEDAAAPAYIHPIHSELRGLRSDVGILLATARDSMEEDRALAHNAAPPTIRDMSAVPPFPLVIRKNPTEAAVDAVATMSFRIARSCKHREGDNLLEFASKLFGKTTEEMKEYRDSKDLGNIFRKRLSEWRTLVAEIMRDGLSYPETPSSIPDTKRVVLPDDKLALFWTYWGGTVVQRSRNSSFDSRVRQTPLTSLKVTTGMKAVAEIFLGSVMFAPGYSDLNMRYMDIIASTRRSCGRSMEYPGEEGLWELLDPLTKNDVLPEALFDDIQRHLTAKRKRH